MKRENCWKPSDEDFIALATGELSSWKKPRLRRHIADCPDCDAAFAGTETILQHARADRLTVTEDSLRERLWESLPPVQESRRRTFPLLTRRLALGGIGVAVAAAALTLALLPGTPGRPTIAFAQVERAMSEIRTATWTDTVQQNWHPGTGLNAKTWKWYHERPPKYENWVQLDPPRYSVRQVRRTGDTRDRDDGFHTVSDGQYAIDGGGERSYFRTNAQMNSLWPKTSAAEAIRREVIFPRNLPPTTNRADSPQEYWRDVERTPWKQSADRLQNRDVLKFVCRITESSKAGERKWRRVSDATIWVDPDSYRILRREIHTLPFGGGGAEWLRVSDGFRYNEAPPSGVFEIAPPVGKLYRYTDLSKDGWILKRPPAPEQQAIRALAQKAVAAWNRRDGKAFTDLWNFNYSDFEAQVYHPDLPKKDTSAERRQHWTNRAVKGIPYKTWKIKKIWTAESWGGVWVRRSESDPFPPDTRPKEYSVTVTGLATFEPGGKPTPCDASFRILRDGDQYRITYINMHKKLAVSAHFKKPPWDEKK